MFKTILFVFLIYLNFAFQLTHLPKNQMLKFDNYTGDSITQPVQDNIKQFINNAYTIYLTDYQSNLGYIQNKIQGAYNVKANVVIIPDNVSGSFSLYSIKGTSVLAWTFVNFAQPKWLYIITFLYPLSDYLNTFVMSELKGTGISAQTFEAAVNLIVGQQAKYPACICAGLGQISSLLSSVDGNQWNIVCSASRAFFWRGWIRNLGSQYLQVYTGTKCIYLLWVI